MVLDTRYTGDPERVALVLPGLTYTPARPLLHFLVRALHARGWTVQELWWEPPADAEQQQAYITERAMAALEEEHAEQVVVLAKCLGTLFLPTAAVLGLPGIWLTPMLDVPSVADAVKTSTTPSLIVGGTRDPHWDIDAARAGGHAVLELSGADHALEIPQDVHGSLQALSTVLHAAQDFVAGLPATRAIDGAGNGFGLVRTEVPHQA
ncbi:alpha/beta hydrolase [Streptomyces sp. NPDC048255]|uniref:alpha/beta hydrolase n=1 Tax=Streptomyces sp. NPDC048255 TaxID=3154713 RepID=UPI0033F52F2E